MATFDIETFLRVNGQQGGGLVDSVGAAFGMPACMTNLAKEALSILPSPILGAVQNQTQRARDAADEVTKNIIAKIFLDTGIIEFDTDEGVLRFSSDSSLFGMDSAGLGLLGDIGGFVGGIAAFGSRMWANYQGIEGQVRDIAGCFDRYKKLLQYESGNASDTRNKALEEEELKRYLEERYASERARMLAAQGFMNAADRVLQDISEIQRDREFDPSLEPVFIEEARFNLSSNTFKFVEQTREETENEIFRLVFGPPKTKTGKFLLSTDGLYFDSQSGSGLELALSVLEKRRSKITDERKWKFDFDPNIGGKGIEISNEWVNTYIGTLFDSNIIDDSPHLRDYYNSDHFLQTLYGQKDKLIYDLSASITPLIAQYGANSAIVQNMKQGLYSEDSRHQDKIRRRKKQIELAVKIPSIFGAGKFSPGNIPINDFSYMREYNLAVALGKQRALTFNSAEVSGVVLPYKPKYTILPDNPEDTSIDHLLVPEIGIGSIVYAGQTYDSTGAPNLGITNTIITDGLFAIYNYLESDVVTTSSTQYLTTNCAVTGTYNNAQLVSDDPVNVFVSGLSIPYLYGITKNNSNNATGLGSYIRLPDTKEFQNWTYNPQGFTFETWMHTPKLQDLDLGWSNGQTSSLYRLVLACENTGLALGTSGQTDIHRLRPDFGDQVVRGLVMGFTRDSRITLGQFEPDGGGTPGGLPTSSLAFFVAPTQSIDASTIGFISRIDRFDSGCASALNWNKMVINASATGPNGVKFTSACQEFMLVTVSVDPPRDSISIYLDANLMATSALSQVFGTRPYAAINLPSFKKFNSFEYGASTLNSTAPNSLKIGPKLNPWFTPWILGGGWTDGMVLRGGFMGNSGRTSGLRGYLGSTKFYNRFLTQAEVLRNFRAQRGAFKSILIQGGC